MLNSTGPFHHLSYLPLNRLAIVGSGIAGLGLAYYLRDTYEMTIYEKEGHLGGHANTVEIADNDQLIPVDTGFMVFNQVTYPLLTRLFRTLSVPIEKTDMSFSVQRLDINLEYSGASLNRLFARRRNLLSLRFWKILSEIIRFNKRGLVDVLDSNLTASLTDYVRMRNYSEDFVSCYLLPMSSAIWSTSPRKMLEFPAISLLRFFKNHGLLGVASHHQWWTVTGGSKQYVKRLIAAMPSLSIINKRVTSVKRGSDAVTVFTEDGGQQAYDMVAFACHADQALKLLHEPKLEERQILGAFAYQRNDTLLHTDSKVMPKEFGCWASWNYRLDKNGSSTHYWMNSLQNVSRQANYFVTLNGGHIIRDSRVLKRIVYRHPIFDLPALRAQMRLRFLNEQSYRDQIFFSGSYFGYGFHEDALLSSAKLAQHLAGKVICL